MKATHQGVCDVLADGPLFSQDVAAFFPSSSHRDVAAILSSLRTAKRKRVYILKWVRTAFGEKHVRRAVYALGDLPDAPPPKNEPKVNATRRYQARRRARGPNSVFDLGRFV